MSCEQLAHALCDVLVAKGHLKAKPAFIRTDREAKLAGIFQDIVLDGAKMASFDNPGPVEMLVRRGTNQEAWVQQVVDALVGMLPEEAAAATKKMSMDDSTKEEMAAAREKSKARMERLQEEREKENVGRGGGDGRDRNADDREERGGWGDGGGAGRARGGVESMECFNCGGLGHSSRDCPEPRKDKGKGKGKGRDRAEMQCNNCLGFGHKSRDCPEPVDEEKVAQRLAARSQRAAQA